MALLGGLLISILRVMVALPCGTRHAPNEAASVVEAAVLEVPATRKGSVR